MSDHKVLIKLIPLDREDGAGERQEQRVGDVLMVTTPCEKKFRDFTSSALDEAEDDVSAIIRIVLRDPALDPASDEQAVKRSRIGDTWLETIKVGATVPA